MTQLFEDPSLGFGNEGDLTVQPSSSVGLADTGVDPLRSAVDQASAPTGLGLATPRPSTRDLTREEIDSKGTMGKIGIALQEFGAGATGQKSPLALRVEEKRKEKLLQMEELKGTVTALEHGTKMVQGMEGESRDKFIKMYADRLDGMDAGLGDTFRAVADRPDVVQNIQKYLPYLPEPMKALAKADTAAFLKMIGTAEGMKEIDRAKNQYYLQSATSKARTLIMGAQHLGVPPELVNELEKNPTASTFLKLESAATDSRVKLSADEQAAINAHPEIFYPSLKLMSPKGEEAVAEDKAKKGTKSAHEIATETELERSHRAHESAEQQRIRLERERLDQEKFSAPLEVSVDGKNTMVRQDKKSGKVYDGNGKDVTDKIAPQIKGSPQDPGRIAMALQAHADITDARGLIFDKNGELNRTVIAAMDVPGTKGVGTEGRKAYSAIENAVAAKLRGETGAATNPGEIENTAARFRPTMMDTKESAKYKIDRLQEFMGMTLDQLKESYHISPETYDKAKNRGKGPEASKTPLAMPAEKSALVPGQSYITSRGVAKWNGTAFIPEG